MNTFWVHKNWKWKKENATAKYIDAQCEEAVTLADAQATIAALEETILKMGENAAVVAKDAMAAKEQIAALQAERDEYKTMYACLTGETYDNPIADLKAQLTQRTAELEAIKADTKNMLDVATSRLREQVNDLQAELERVRGERDEANELVAALSSKVAEYEVELNGDPQNFYGRGRTVGLRTLIAALPKVEGEIRVAAVMHPNHFDEWHISAGDTWIMTIAGKQSADSVLCALQHRQGMEG